MAGRSVPLAPVVKTAMLPRLTRAGRTGLECWRAETTDGVWVIGREESPGTPWITVHKPTGIAVGLDGTLRAARACIAAGHAAAALERLQAHDRGEHAGARDMRCVRCP